MTADLARPPRLERLVARLLSCGTGLAASVIALGLALQFLGWPAGVRVVSIGVALFILLPVLRVLLMLVVFCLDGDYRFAAIAAFVLATIILGILFGIGSA